MTTNIMEKIQKQAEFVVTPKKWDTVIVEFGSGIVPGFAESYTQALNNKIALRGSSITFDAAELQAYLNYLLANRIDSVNGKRFEKATKHMLVPSLFAVALTNVGIVRDKDLGIESRPSYSDKIEMMSTEQAIAYSRDRLTIIEDLGFELVEGLPRDIQGDANFMYFTMSEDEILRHNNDAHPAFGVIAAFFRMNRLQDAVLPRVTYGLISEYDDMLRGLISDEARNGSK